MKTYSIKGTEGREVKITEDDGTFYGRLYVNGGETACFQNNRTKTRAGIERWARRVLERGA